MNIDFNSFENGQNKNLLVMVIDNQGRIIFLNKAMEQFTGRSFKELKELKAWELYTGAEDSKLIKEYFVHFDSDLFPRKFRGKMLTKEGAGKDIKWTNNVLLNRDNQIDRVICFGKVLSSSEDDEYEDSYISNETKNENDGNAADKHCFCITNDKGKILDISDSYCELSGYNRRELLKMSIQNMDGNSNSNDLSAKIQKVISQGYIAFSARQKLRNGDFLDIEVNASYTQNFGGLIFFSINGQEETAPQTPVDQNKPEFRQYLRAQIMDKVTELIFIHDFNGNLIYVNEPACKKLGYTKKEIFEIKLNDLLSQDNPDTYENIIKQLINKSEIHIECKYNHKNGSQLNMALRAQIMSVSNRKLILSIAQENNEVNGVKNDLNELINNIVDAFSVIDKNCNIMNCNESFCQLCGYDNEEITGTSLEDLLITNGDGKLKQYLIDVEKGNPHHFTSLLKQKNGKKINIELGARYVSDEEGKFYTLVHNVTKQKILADGYKNSLEINNLLTTNSKSIVYRVTFSPNLKFDYISDSINMVLGYPAKEFYENPDIFFKIANPDDIKHIESISGEFHENPYTLRCTHKDGTVMRIETNNKPIYDGDGKLVGYEGNARDVTLISNMESELNKRSSYINAITRNLNIGVAIISGEHDIIWQNSIAAELFPEHANKKCYELLHNSEQVCPDCILQGNRHEEQNTKYITVNSGNNGDAPQEYEVMTVPLNDSDEKVKELIELFIPVKATIPEQDEDSEITVTDNKLTARSSSLLCEMNELLNSCINVKEVKKTVSRYLPKLFPMISGSMFLYKSSVNLFEPMISWGNSPNSSSIFPPEACLAIRRGKKYIANSEEDDDICEHINKTATKSYVEIPMIYQNENIGLLHLQDNEMEKQDNTEDDSPALNDEMILLAQVTADQIASVFTCFRLKEKLQEQAKQDQATGLYNRKYMEQTLEREIYMVADDQEHQVGIIILSLENFNDFVESQGHHNGDFVLRNFGALLRNGCAAEDIVCRCDANKFAIIIPHSTRDQIKQKAVNIYEIAKFINIGDNNSSFIALHLSIGIALYPDHGKNTEEILKTAYNAITANREKGNNATELNIDGIKESVKH
jgi:diguanylate cyclase (GGDEF)-like protein/PAS domain S-box-containing protein